MQELENKISAGTVIDHIAGMTAIKHWSTGLIVTQSVVLIIVTLYYSRGNMAVSTLNKYLHNAYVQLLVLLLQEGDLSEIS